MNSCLKKLILYPIKKVLYNILSKIMQCHILTIGNELLNGDISDTNSQYLQEQLSPISIPTMKIAILPDKVENIKNEIIQSIKQNVNYIFITGGLGPTEDDITRNAIALAINKKLVKSHPELTKLKQKLNTKTISKTQERQVFFPLNTTIIENDRGTAQGIYIVHKNSHIFAMPGVPFEMKHMFENNIIPLIKGSPINRRRLVVKTFGIGESTLNNIIKDKIIKGFKDISFEITAAFDGVRIKIYSNSNSLSNTLSKSSFDKLAIIKSACCKELGKHIYAFDQETMQSNLHKILTAKKLTLSTVESCTGGLAGAYLTDYPGSSSFFKGCIVAYSNEIKEQVVKVDKDILVKHGAVSSEVAIELAKNGKKILQSDICVAITGIAGPGADDTQKEIGSVFFALIKKDNTIISKFMHFQGDRQLIRKKAAFFALNLIRTST